MDYKVIEQYPSYQQPVGSVINAGDHRILYRNITDRHYFRKGTYTALFVDDAVIQWLKQNDPDVSEIVFDDGRRTLTVALAQYDQARAVKMAGRLQRGLSVDRFREGKPLTIARPEEARIVKVETN